ncbi:MAG TPA: energy transducer TonB [Candidatus Sulfotelmatobacter sp.]|jgi:TonB family protein|nr:energy transducer TonB [Candidatus Sulfotelmatobacter sp.]
MATMIADAPTSRSLGVGFSPNRGRTGNSEAWKQNIGTRQVPARLALLPEAKPNWRRVGFSAAVQLTIVAFFILVPILYPEQMKTAIQYSYTAIAQPITMIPVAPPPPPPPKVKAVVPKVAPKPAPVEPPKLNPQQPHIFANLVAPKALKPKTEKLEIKDPDMSPKFEAVKIDVKENGPKRPKDDVKVNNLGSGSAAPATVVAPVEKVQTGGFGDPNGVAGKGDPKHATNVARLGSPALPGGEGYGNGTGGKEGIRGTVASTGFGNGTAIPPTGGKKGSVASTGFANASDATAEAPKKKQQAAGAADTAPTILEKPKPEYTAEGRSLKIEGDVVVDMVFLANGTVQINRVISGLGHGLDEAAVRSAQQIKFKPAKRAGESVDFPARVRIEFRLAY